MGRRSDAGEAVQECVGRGIEELVGDAEDSALAHGSQVVPATLGYDSLQWNSGAGSAPGEEQDVGVGGGDIFGSGVGSGRADIKAARGFD